ncbi:MAG: hypothetical protein L6R40_001546 [Gallowayella cf. fulva]|nr:MAG: hypothetical protein L6R40_001546 [Xanthomendoza cf. fulva]
MLDLPNEVLLEIISNVRNADLDSFASTCKVLRTLAAPALREHRDRKELYAKITYGQPKDKYEENFWLHPTLMLRHLLSHDLFCYPTSLAIRDHNYPGAEWDDGRQYDDDGTVIHGQSRSDVDLALESFPKDVEPLIRPFSHLHRDVDLTSAILEDGDIGATLGSLLYLLPNLMTLNITDYNERSDGMANLKQILDDVLAASNQCSQNAAVASAPPLSKLNHVTFTRSDCGNVGDNWELEMWAPLFYLPSMRTVRSDHLRAPEEKWNYPRLRSKIEKLIISYPDLGLTSLDTYLRDIENLRCFCLSNDHQRFKMREVVQKLLVYARHSLYRLELGTTGYFNESRFTSAGAGFIGSLQAFEQLKIIHLEGPMFVEPVETEEKVMFSGSLKMLGRSCRLIDVLPPSIVSITIDLRASTGNLRDEHKAIAMLEGLPEGRKDLLPNLENITFITSGIARIKSSALLSACKEAGVAIYDWRRELN